MMTSTHTISMLCYHAKALTARPSMRNEYTNRRCGVATGDRSPVKRHVRKQTGTLVATLLLRVAWAILVAAVYADLLGRLLVRAPALLVLQDGEGEFALAFVVASAKRLVDIGA